MAWHKHLSTVVTAAIVAAETVVCLFSLDQNEIDSVVGIDALISGLVDEEVKMDRQNTWASVPNTGTW